MGLNALRRRVLESLAWINSLLLLLFYNLNDQIPFDGVLIYSDVATHTMGWHLDFHFSSGGDLGKKSVVFTQFISVVPKQQQPLRLDFL